MYSRLIILLKDEQIKMAQNSLRRPKTVNAEASFSYGYVCGMYAGIESAILIIEEQMKKENYDPDDR